MSCDCVFPGSVGEQCDGQGMCDCLPGVTGAKCDQCLPGFFGLSSSGCEGIPVMLGYKRGLIRYYSQTCLHYIVIPPKFKVLSVKIKDASKIRTFFR